MKFPGEGACWGNAMKITAFIILVGVALAAALFVYARPNQGTACAVPNGTVITPEVAMQFQVVKSDEEWKKVLTPEQYRVMRRGETERPFTGPNNDRYAEGIYLCPGCGTPLFSSFAKYDHGTGWPSFSAPLDVKNLLFLKDTSFGMVRTEVRCAVCGAHLGHLFDDGPGPAGAHYCINSASLEFKPASASAFVEKQTLEKATFAAGCFWGVQFEFDKIKGVVSTAAGYAGGHTDHPTYRQVCSDATGHAESVEVDFDPSQVSYGALLDAFFKLHDPTTEDRQGPDIGSQYRSIIFYHSDEQKKQAEAKIAELEKSGTFHRPIVTEVLPAGQFWKAEDYHQKYIQKHGGKSCAL